MASTNSFFMSIPLDLRYIIYELVLLPNEDSATGVLPTRLDTICRQIRKESKRMYANSRIRTAVFSNFWVPIDTWPRDERSFQIPLFDNQHSDIAYVTVPGLLTRRWLPDRWPFGHQTMPSKSRLLPHGRSIRHDTEPQTCMDIVAWAREGYETHGSKELIDACLDQREAVLLEVAERFKVYSEQAPQQYQRHAQKVLNGMNSDVEVWGSIRSGHYLV